MSAEEWRVKTAAEIIRDIEQCVGHMASKALYNKDIYYVISPEDWAKVLELHKIDPENTTIQIIDDSDLFFKLP